MKTAGICYGLFFGCRPATIIRFVVAIIVDTVNRMFWRRAMTHIGEEILEELPAFTNLDTSTAVPMKSTHIGILAARMHTCPDSIFGSWRLAFICAVNCLVLLTPFFFKAATTHGISAPEGISANYGLAAAIALTMPQGLASPAGSSAHSNRKFAEPLTYQIYKNAGLHCSSLTRNALVMERS